MKEKSPSSPLPPWDMLGLFRGILSVQLNAQNWSKVTRMWVLYARATCRDKCYSRQLLDQPGQFGKGGGRAEVSGQKAPQAITIEEELGNKSGEKKKKTNDLSPTKYNFVERLFDTILIEIATASGTVKEGERSSPEDPKYFVAEFGELATCFMIAQEVCQVEATLHSSSETSHWSVDLLAELSQAGLSRKEIMKDYANTMHKRDGGIFRVCTGAAAAADGTDDDDKEDSSSSPYKWDVIPSGQHLMVPIIGPEDIDRRYYYRREIPVENHRIMMAFIVYKLRMTLWKDRLLSSCLQPEDVMKQVGVQYGCSKQLQQLPLKNGLESLQQQLDDVVVKEKLVEKVVVDVQHGSQKQKFPLNKDAKPFVYSNKARDAQKLKGLKIKTSGRKKTFGLQGEHELDLAPNQDYMNKRTDLIRRLEDILNEGFPGYNLRVEVFGSFASGLRSQSSDVNLFMLSSDFRPSALYNNMTKVAQVLGSAGMTKILPIPTARVPIVKFCDPKTNIECDINSNHVLEIYNSEMIGCYTLIDDRVKPFIYTLKALVKRHNIHNSGIDYLSRYSYVMMAIGFLQAQEPPILPALQAQPEEYMTLCHVLHEHAGREGEGVIDCTFDRDPTRHWGFGAANIKSIGQLLIEFFEFYSRYFDYQTMEVNIRLGGGVRVRDEITLARAKGDVKNIPRNGEGVKKLVVMDPFLRDQNIAEGCKPFNLARIWGVFEDLYLTLSFRVFQPIPNVLEAARKEWEEEQEKDQLAPNIAKTRQEKRKEKRQEKKARNREKKAKEEQEKKAKEEQEMKEQEMKEQEMKEQEMKEMKEQEMKEMKEQEMKEMKEQEIKAKEAVALAAASAAAASSSSSSSVASPATVVGSLKAQQTLAIKEELKSALTIPVQSTVKSKATVASGTTSVPAIVPNSNGVPKLVRWQEPLEEVRQKNHQKHPRRPRRPRQNKQRLREQQQQQQQQEQQQQQQDQQQQQEQQQQHEQQRQQEQEQQQQQEQQRQQEQQQLEEAQRKKHKNHLRKLRRQHNKQMGLLQEQQQEQQQQQQQQQQNQQQQKQKQQKPMSRERS
ncbi:hypothetical protein BGZ65_002649 [Modicella reniformis]|uniref:polynucleotide adenylyltransferase n=1 Tax=Modicella reniformis TaxID=1440133 RepID=A0A9P6M314_9FUNG|nr:hypothetical protein BGZ65_002649 [Modicella reniformis]